MSAREDLESRYEALEKQAFARWITAAIDNLEPPPVILKRAASVLKTKGFPVDASALCRWRSGSTKPGFQRFAALCHALGTTAQDAVTEITASGPCSEPATTGARVGWPNTSSDVWYRRQFGALTASSQDYLESVLDLPCGKEGEFFTIAASSIELAHRDGALHAEVQLPSWRNTRVGIEADHRNKLEANGHHPQQRLLEQFVDGHAIDQPILGRMSAGGAVIVLQFGDGPRVGVVEKVGEAHGHRHVIHAGHLCAASGLSHDHHQILNPTLVALHEIAEELLLLAKIERSWAWLVPVFELGNTDAPALRGRLEWKRKPEFLHNVAMPGRSKVSAYRPPAKLLGDADGRVEVWQDGKYHGETVGHVVVDPHHAAIDVMFVANVDCSSQNLESIWVLDGEIRRNQLLDRWWYLLSPPDFARLCAGVPAQARRYNSYWMEDGTIVGSRAGDANWPIAFLNPPLAGVAKAVLRHFELPYNVVSRPQINDDLQRRLMVDFRVAAKQPAPWVRP